ncbi:hypothetical protein DFH07DRAFT_1009259 [Mycena maculata]|uniref:Nuclear condensin complex subunit 3 C-terminal domain-containing protein n=1 Tax=Mycena maculata TaxID=230809 RepID=A0AAD7JMB6_9AGAR|nr:hypothetical protein DFH07DRAFT_1009259 [Mycena maculata]
MGLKSQYVPFVNEKGADTGFTPGTTQCVESLAALEAKANRQPEVPTNSISSGSADDKDTLALVFVSAVLEWLIQGFVAKNKVARYQTVHFVAEMILYLGDIDEDGYLTLRESLVERSTCDKESPIRAQAVSALARLAPSELQDGENPRGPPRHPLLRPRPLAALVSLDLRRLCIAQREALVPAHRVVRPLVFPSSSADNWDDMAALLAILSLFDDVGPGEEPAAGALRAVAELTGGGGEGADEAEKELGKTEAVLGELLRIATRLDYGDEIGRRRVYAVTRDMLAHPQLPPSLIVRCLDMLVEIMPSERELVRVVVEVVTDLREPPEDDADADAEAAADTTQSTKSTQHSLQRPRRARAWTSSTCGVWRSWWGCLSAMRGILMRLAQDFEDNSTLEGVLADLIVPTVRRKKPAICEQGLVALGLCCLIAKSTGCAYAYVPLAADEGERALVAHGRAVVREGRGEGGGPERGERKEEGSSREGGPKSTRLWLTG